jgi:hypothetical protein
MRALILTASVFCLFGCTTPQEEARKQQAEMDRMMVEYGPACTQLGYPVNTDPWRNCVVQLGAKNGANRGVSTSVFGSWGSWGRGSGVGIGIGVGR